MPSPTKGWVRSTAGASAGPSDYVAPDFAQIKVARQRETDREANRDKAIELLRKVTAELRHWVDIERIEEASPSVLEAEALLKRIDEGGG
jgi:hypothetical protein